jgi:cyclophilin family peptidyl-prolyl cis-trans isomerase
MACFGKVCGCRFKIASRAQFCSLLPVFCNRFIFALAVVLGTSCGRAGTLAQFRTPFGDLELELYDQDKPVTVQNFIRYIQTGAYQNEFSHRLVPGFVVQGGGFNVVNRGTTNAGISQIPTFSPITNEFGVGRRLSNAFGTIAMAKQGGNTNSATSQWFINLANNTFLDAADTNNLFVVFGRVIKGTNILNTLNTFQTYTGTQKSNLVTDLDPLLNYVFYPNFATCPLLRPAFTETNLLFFDITLLQVAVKTVGGGREISWNSATGLTNVVEYTTNFPAQWTTLVKTNGNGNRFAVVDAVANPRRFYRVRVEF